jgi:hypothetical protein
MNLRSPEKVPSLSFVRFHVAKEQKLIEENIEFKLKKIAEEKKAQEEHLAYEDPTYSIYLPTAAEVKQNSMLGITDHLFLEGSHTIDGHHITIITANIYDPRASYGFAPQHPLPSRARAEAIINVLKGIKKEKNPAIIMLQEEFIYSNKEEVSVDIVEELKKVGLTCIYRTKGNETAGILTIYNPDIFAENPKINSSLEIAGESKQWGGAPHKWLRTPLIHKKSGKPFTYCNAYCSYTPFPYLKSKIVINALKKDAKETKSDVIMAGDFNSNIYTKGQPRITQISQPQFRGKKGYGSASTDGGFTYFLSKNKTEKIVFTPIDHLKYLNLSLKRGKIQKKEEERTLFEKNEIDRPRMYMHVSDEDTQWMVFPDQKMTLEKYQENLRLLTKDADLLIERAIGMNEDDKPVMIVMPSRNFFPACIELLKIKNLKDSISVRQMMSMEIIYPL